MTAVMGVTDELAVGQLRHLWQLRWMAVTVVIA